MASNQNQSDDASMSGHKRRHAHSTTTTTTTTTTSSGTNTNISTNDSNNSISTNNSTSNDSNSLSLTFLGLSKSWMAATKRAKSHPEEAQYGCTSSARTPLPLHVQGKHNMASSPLAIACRYGAPPETVQAILNADKNMVRRCIPNRGTPLHEAIMAYPRLPNNASHDASHDPSHSHSQSQSQSQSHANDMHYQQYVQVIRMLLEADEQLERDGNATNQKRATLMQDVDGNVPLHLLVRQAFYHYLGGIRERQRQLQRCINSNGNGNGNSSGTHPILTIIQELIKSCPEASAMPDFTEYEETPLILVIKSSMAANEQQPQDDNHNDNGTDNDNPNDNNAPPGVDFNHTAELERHIFDMCKLILQSHPYAASFAASKSGYTAVHSAVFHGRCCDTIRLLLNADATYRKQLQLQLQLQLQQQSCNNPLHVHVHVPIAAAMRANRFGETPLHFATMRGECTRTIELLSQAAPWAVLKRDVKFGMTPLHWLLVRFVDTMFEQFGERSFQIVDDHVDDDHGGDGVSNDDDVDDVSNDDDVDANDATTNNEPASASPQMHANALSSISSLQSASFGCNYGDDDDHIRFDVEYHRRTVAIDPPVDYMRMRHILSEHAEVEGILTNRVITVLSRVRERHRRLMKNMKNRQREQQQQEQDSKPAAAVCPFSGKEVKEASSSSRDDGTSCPFTRRQEETVTHQMKPYHVASVHHEVLPAGGQDNTRAYGAGSNNHAAAALVAQPQHAALDSADDSDPRKCPFRCPFVFDSYPIDPALMGSEEEAVREEQVISLFWAKVTSLLHATAVAQQTNENDSSFSTPVSIIDDENIFMLHSACLDPSPLAVVRLCLSLYPEQLLLRDPNGKLPLHHAACRVWDVKEFSMIKSNTNANTSSSSSSSGGPPTRNLIENESAKALELILRSSPTEAAETLDNENRLPFHHAIDSAIKAVVAHQYGKSKETEDDGNQGVVVADDKSLFSVINVLRSMMRINPEAKEKKDGRTGLYPFMQASAIATESISRYDGRKKSDKVTLSIIYSLLLENPSLAVMGLR